MKLIQRIDDNPEQVKLVLKAIDKYPDSVTDVWLNTAYGYPKNEDHFKVAERFAEYADLFRKKGITVSLQLSNTLGHGQYMLNRDCSGLLFNGSPVRHMVGANGKTAEYGFCWNDEYFKKYITQHVSKYIEKVRPAEIWIDDDLRARNHAPVDYGCFCENCISEFNRLHNLSLTREEIVDTFLHGDINIRKKWINFVRDGLSKFVSDICYAVKNSCSDTIVCLQNGENRSYTGYGYDHLLDVMYQITGYAPMYRAGGGTYSDHDPNKVINKMIQIDHQHNMLPEYVTERCPEIESLPDNSMGKTMYGHALETAVYLATGATGMSYAMMGDLDEPAEFYLKGFELFAKQRKYYEMLSKVSRYSINGGITYAESKFPHLRKMPENSVMADFYDEKYEGANKLFRNGFPISYGERKKGVYILHPHTARQMQVSEIKALVSKNVITDADTVLYMKELGIDLGIDGVMVDTDERLGTTEHYTEHKVNGVYHNEFSPSFFTSGLDNYYKITKVPSDSEILGVYKFKSPNKIYDIKDAPNGYSSVILHNKEGGKWAVIGCGLWKSVVPSYQRDRLMNIIDYISEKAPAARLLTPTQNVVIPRVFKDSEKTMSVNILNCTIEPQERVKLTIRRPKCESFKFVSQYDGEFDLQFEKSGDDYLVILPKISPWSMATVFCIQY